MVTTAYNLSQTEHEWFAQAHGAPLEWNGEVWNEEMETGERGHGKKKFIHYIIV